MLAMCGSCWELRLNAYEGVRKKVNHYVDKG